MADGEDVRMDLPQETAQDPVLHGAATEAEPRELRCGDDPLLRCGEVADRPVDVGWALAARHLMDRRAHPRRIRPRPRAGVRPKRWS
jgi:hypothetical protein